MGRGHHPELAALERLAKSLERNLDVEAVIALRNEAIEVRSHVAAGRNGKAIVSHADELILRFDQRAGQILSTLIKRGGNRRSASSEENLTLAALHIDHNQSARWRREAAVPEPLFQEYIKACRRDGKKISGAGLIKLQRSLRTEPASGPTANRRAAVQKHSRSDRGVRTIRVDIASGVYELTSARTKARHGAKLDPTNQKLFDAMDDERILLAKILVPLCRDKDASVLTSSQKRLIASSLDMSAALFRRFRQSCCREVMVGTKKRMASRR